MADLAPKEVHDRVPQAYRFLAAARLRAAETWKNPEAIKRYMRLRAHNEAPPPAVRLPLGDRMHARVCPCVHAHVLRRVCFCVRDSA